MSADDATDPDRTPNLAVIEGQKGVAAWFRAQGISLSNRNKLWKWVLGAFIALLGIISVIVIRFKSDKQKKEIERLQKAHDDLQHTIQISKTLSAFESKQEEADKLLATAKDATEKAGQIELELKKVRDAQEKTVTTIDAIKNWRDVDRYLADRSKG